MASKLFDNDKVKSNSNSGTLLCTCFFFLAENDVIAILASIPNLWTANNKGYNLTHLRVQ